MKRNEKKNRKEKKKNTILNIIEWKLIPNYYYVYKQEILWKIVI